MMPPLRVEFPIQTRIRAARAPSVPPRYEPCTLLNDNTRSANCPLRFGGRTAAQPLLPDGTVLNARAFQQRNTPLGYNYRLNTSKPARRSGPSRVFMADSRRGTSRILKCGGRSRTRSHTVPSNHRYNKDLPRPTGSSVVQVGPRASRRLAHDSGMWSIGSRNLPRGVTQYVLAGPSRAISGSPAQRTGAQ